MDTATDAFAVNSGTELQRADDPEEEPATDAGSADHATAAIVDYAAAGSATMVGVDEDDRQAPQDTESGSSDEDESELLPRVSADAEGSSETPALAGVVAAGGERLDREDEDMLLASGATSPAGAAAQTQTAHLDAASAGISSFGEARAVDEDVPREGAAEDGAEEADTAHRAQADTAPAEAFAAAIAVAERDDPAEAVAASLTAAPGNHPAEEADAEVMEVAGTLPAAGLETQAAGEDEAEAVSSSGDPSQAVDVKAAGDEARMQTATERSAPVWRRAHDAAAAPSTVQSLEDEGAEQTDADESAAATETAARTGTAEAAGDSSNDTVGSESQTAEQAAAENPTAGQDTADDPAESHREDGHRSNDDKPDEVHAGASEDGASEE